MANLVLPELGLRTDISFLVDTGADHTVLSPVDAQRMGLDYQALERPEEGGGIGGAARYYVERALALFVDTRRLAYAYNVELRVLEPEAAPPDLPSILGRDILDRWIMVYAPTRNRLRFTVVSADETIPIR